VGPDPDLAGGLNLAGGLGQDLAGGLGRDPGLGLDLGGDAVAGRQGPGVVVPPSAGAAASVGDVPAWGASEPAASPSWERIWASRA
jgi:hypothetical protein